MPGAETRTSAHLCTMPLSVTVTATKLILSASGLQIRFNGQDIVEAKPVPRNIPNTIPQSQEWYVSLKLTGAAKEVYENGIYELRLLDIDPSSQPTWTNNQAGAEQAAADIAVMIRSASGGGGGGQVDTIVPGPGIDVDSTDPANPIVSTRQKNSIEVDANELQLVGDEASPGNSEYYGTDSGGNKGFYPLPSPGTGDVVGPASSTDNNVPQWDGVTGKLLKDGLGISTGGNNAADGGKLVRFRADGDIYFSNNASGSPSISALSTGAGDGVEASADTGDGIHAVSNTGRGAHVLAGGSAPAVHANGQSTGLALEAEQNGGGGADIALFHDGSGDGLEVKTDGGLEWTSATGAQTTADNLPVFGAATKGVVPAAGAVPSAANFLDETGNWSTPVPGVKNSVEVDSGDIQLVGDSASPGNNVFYGTDSSGTRSFYRPPLIFSINSAASTLTNHANALELLTPTSPGILITKLDLTGFTQVMLQIHVFAASASGNSPRIILGYATSYTTTAGSFSDIGTSAVTCSMSSTGVIRSAWTDLAAGAIGDVWIAPLSNGGNGGADPLIQGITAYFR